MPMSPDDEENIQEIIWQCDLSISYGEFLDPKDEDYDYAERYIG